jgi:hypothetical protein
MKSQRRFSFAVCTAFVFAIFAMCVSAQEFRGTITGSVTDPNGAVVPGAKVTIKNVETNVAVTVVSNDSGSYTVPSLVPGTYNISVTGDGFKTSSRENVQVRVDDRLTIDFKLEVGAAAEVNIVLGDDVIERGSVTTGTVVSSRQIQELPLAEGAAYVLALQAPGVVYTGDPNFTGPTANGNLAGFRTNGTAGNLINLDGSPNLGSSGNVAFTPPADAVQEFKVNTNSFDAQNGFTAGSVVNVAVKSGTNKFHGAAYYFNRDKSRTANSFFNNRDGRDRPERKYYRLGGMVNGPIFRDRTFFLGSFERQNDNVAQSTTFFVPTEKQRNGDFSEIPGTVIYNPFSAFTGSGPYVCPTNNVCRTAFTGNIITPGLIKPYAKAYLNLYPLPNLPVQNGVGRFVSDMNLHRPYKAYLGRIDHNINGNHKIFGKYYYSKSQEDRYNWFGEEGSPTQGFEYRINKGGNVDYTAMISSTLIFDVRGSYNLFSLQRAPAAPISPADLGMTAAAIADFRDAAAMPRMDFASFSSTAISNAVGSNRADYGEGRLVPFNLFSLQPMLTQIWGNHTLKYGYDFRQLHESFDSKGFNAGRFLFDGTYTVQCRTTGTGCTTAANTAGQRNAYGRDLAAFLMGIPTANSNSLVDNPTSYDVKSNYHGFFIQDDWRVNSKLTLNLGLRYELEGGFVDTQDRIVTGFDRTTANPLQAAAQANFASSPPASVTGPFNVVGGLLFADGSNREVQSSDNNNFQPRIGVSYAVTSKTVIRAGFAIFTAPFQIQAPNQSGFSTPTLFVPSTGGNSDGLVFTSTLDDPLPNGVAPSPGSSLGLATFIGRDLTVLSHERENAQFKRYMIGVQHELPWGIGIEATFVGAKGSNIAVGRPINYIPLQFLNTATIAFDQAKADFLSANVSNPFRTLVPSNTGYNGSTIARRSLLTAYPEFGNVTLTEYNGSNTYYALQFQVVKRFTKGLSLNASYTRSREREKSQRLNPQDAELTEQIAPNDRPHRFTMSAIYELPIGKGRALGSNWNQVMDAIFGGWQLQTSYERQSGEPLIFGNVYFNGDPATLKARLGEKDSEGRRYGIDIPAFDVTGFYPAGTVLNGASTTPTAINVGNNNTQAANTARYFPLTSDGLRNQRFLNFNVGMSKNFRIREGMKIQFRVEAVNFLNNPYFSLPSLVPVNNMPNLVTAGADNLGKFGFTSNPQRQPPRDIQLGFKFTF